MDYTSNEEIARKVFRALKTPSDGDRTTDPILAFHYKDRSDYLLLRCNKTPELSVKGSGQIAGEVKFFAYSDFREYDEKDVLFRLREEVSLIELYKRGAVGQVTFDGWREFCRWLDTLDENGVQISLKLPCLVYREVRDQQPSMQTFIVEAIKRNLRDRNSGS